MESSQTEIIDKTIQYVQHELAQDSSGHDWWHIYRVWRNAINISQHEQADSFVVQLAALLHDIADWKLHGGDEDIGPRLAGEWLKRCGVDENTILHVCTIVREVSFKGAGVGTKINTIEGMIVQDADRLDAIGAIGIGRTFTYGGHKGRPMYDPNLRPTLHTSFEQYKNSHSPTINHFYEKLLLLKDLMNTNTARVIAQNRHEFMKVFLDRFYEEWDGKDSVV
jgi:uncharacterized protein